MTNFIRGFDSTYIPTITVTPQTSETIPPVTVTNTQANELLTNLTTGSFTRTRQVVSSSKPITSLSYDTLNILSSSTWMSIDGPIVIPEFGSTTATIIINGNDVSVRYPVTLTRTIPTKQTIITGYATGSFCKNVYDLAASAILGQTPSASIMNLLSAAVLNPSLYTNSIIDVTAFSMGGSRIASLISPKHALICNHSHGNTNDTLIFNGTTYTISAYTAIANSDLGVYTLSTPVTGVTPYSFLPIMDVVKTKAPSVCLSTQYIEPYITANGLYGMKDIPAFVIKVKLPVGGGADVRQVQLCGLNIMSSDKVYTTYNDGIETNPWSTPYGTDDVRIKFIGWYNQITTGDSGSPVLLPTGLTNASGKPKTILIGTTTTTTSLGNPSNHVAAINAVMAGDGYTLDIISTSEAAWWNAFNNY